MLNDIRDFISIQNNSYPELLSEEAIVFLRALHDSFNHQRKLLLEKRKEREKQIVTGKLPCFLEETAYIRSGNWVIGEVPKDLQDRRVEITGPVDAKMIINALNSGANVFMADFEDSNSPTWENVLAGQKNLWLSNRRELSYFDKTKNKKYCLNDNIATLVVRPRGWHLEEKNVLIKGERMSASLFDFGLYFFHNIQYLLSKGKGVYLYLPKLENHFEAKLWNDVFVFAQNYLSVPQGSIKVTVLIETILASFELDEILFVLKEHVVGLNCGRWDYIFSYIKKLRYDKRFILPDRSQVTMMSPFMKAYSELVIQTCHKRGAFAMGGMSAFIPIKDNEEANQNALNKVREDKEREAKAGHDGTWVAHPGLVLIAKEQFDKYMPKINQLDKMREDVRVTEDDLLKPAEGYITMEGFVLNVDVSLQYIESWLRGVGCVPIYNMMEDAATAEISRAQLWQWVYHGAKLVDGRIIDGVFFEQVLHHVLENFERSGKMNVSNHQFKQASEILRHLVLNEDFVDFLTLSAYEQIE